MITFILTQQSYEQAAYRKGFSTEDHLLSLTLLVEKAREWNSPVWLAFIDFEKAFEAYIAGEWDYAKPAMQALLVQQPDDQLVQLALDFVQTSDKAAWKGYREDLDV